MGINLVCVVIQFSGIILPADFVSVGICDLYIAAKAEGLLEAGARKPDDGMFSFCPLSSVICLLKRAYSSAG